MKLPGGVGCSRREGGGVRGLAVGKGPDPGLGQARSYAFWLKPAYYLVTAGDYLTVWNYQGGAVPDVRVTEARAPAWMRASMICTRSSTRRQRWPRGATRSSCSRILATRLMAGQARTTTGAGAQVSVQ
jgi:hypothetical protein